MSLSVTVMSLNPATLLMTLLPMDTSMSTLSLPEVMWREQEMERVELCQVCDNRHHITFMFAYPTALHLLQTK